jgi:hypothetical protein
VDEIEDRDHEILMFEDFRQESVFRNIYTAATPKGREFRDLCRTISLKSREIETVPVASKLHTGFV